MKLFFTAILLASRAIMGAEAAPYTGTKTVASTYPSVCQAPDKTDVYVLYPTCILTADKYLPSATALAAGPGTTLRWGLHEPYFL